MGPLHTLKSQLLPGANVCPGVTGSVEDATALEEAKDALRKATRDAELTANPDNRVRIAEQAMQV